MFSKRITLFYNHEACQNLRAGCEIAGFHGSMCLYFHSEVVYLLKMMSNSVKECYFARDGGKFGPHTT